MDTRVCRCPRPRGERESAARAMGACASRCAREEMRGFGVVMSRGASSDAGGGRRADG